jgi:CRISPR/Cas system CSM-associated protein Csm2 small subunit
MSYKKCEICEDPIDEKFSMCKVCFNSTKFPNSLKFDKTFFENSRLKRDVYLDKPKRIALLFQQGKDKRKMSMNKLRAFFCVVRNAYDSFAFDDKNNFDKVKPQLWKLITSVEDRTRREITPPSFNEFIKTCVAIAENDTTGRELYGFVELFRSVIAYSK